MHLLANAIRPYAWGSTTHIPRLLGRPVTDEPAAELWLGAHGGDPSRLDDGRSLADLIAADPAATVGGDVCRDFGPRLPFLLKVLAAAEPLSLQVHPTSQRALLGFARENAIGLALDAPERNYRDDSHKPELIFALTRFEGVAGFRDVGRTAAIARNLELPWLTEMADELEAGAVAFQSLRQVVTRLLALDRRTVAQRIAELGEAAASAERRGHRVSPRSRPPAVDRFSVEREGVRVYAQTARLARSHPDDPGVLVTLLLNHVVLAAGEAMFIDAGVLHAYTSGLGVEIMASSDNVVRAGLTPKHTDIPELLAITDFTPLPAPLWLPSTEDPSDIRLDPPVTEFSLRISEAPSVDLPDHGPRILLVLDGALTVDTAEDSRHLNTGQSIFIAHADGALRVTGAGRFAFASVPGQV